MYGTQWISSGEGEGVTSELRERLYTKVDILRSDKEKIERKAKEKGTDVETIIEWLVEEHLDDI